MVGFSSVYYMLGFLVTWPRMWWAVPILRLRLPHWRHPSGSPRRGRRQRIL